MQPYVESLDDTTDRADRSPQFDGIELAALTE